MANPSHTLDRLLDLKRRVTDEHRVALSQKQATLREAELRLNALSDELDTLQRELREQMRRARVISPTQMLLGDQLRQSVLETIEVQQAEVREAEQAASTARNNLLEARRDERVVELLRERELHRHATRRRRLEVLHIDEMSSLRYQRERLDKSRD